MTATVKRSSSVGLNPHLWDLKIAVEHENNLNDWSDEIIKLVHIKCPLKVIIAYNHCNERGDEEQKKLDFIAECMRETEAFKAGEGVEEYLVIIGNAYSSETKNAEYEDCGYVGYLYDWESNSFVKT